MYIQESVAKFLKLSLKNIKQLKKIIFGQYVFDPAIEEISLNIL